MVAIVQGGSQALSRSLYAAMSPASKSGEFFGLFGVMEKFASLIGPLLFAAAGLLFGSSRPAILSLIALFLTGILLLNRVNVEEGRRVAQEEDAAALST
jgi:UMF1 family MFS transporter